MAHKKSALVVCLAKGGDDTVEGLQIHWIAGRSYDLRSDGHVGGVLQKDDSSPGPAPSRNSGFGENDDGEMHRQRNPSKLGFRQLTRSCNYRHLNARSVFTIGAEIRLDSRAGKEVVSGSGE